MNILLVGNGAREHAIAWRLSEHSGAKLFAYTSANNPGITSLCKKTGGEVLVGDIYNAQAIAKWAVGKKIELAFASPDAVLEAGVSDALIAAGIATASPIKAAARLEWDKSFCRNLMQKHKIDGCPRFGVFSDADQAADFIDELGGEVAVKPAGLTGGKGVKVTGYQLKDGEEAKAYAREVLETKMGKLPEVVLEERLIGEEFTLQAFVDGKHVIGMPAVQDFKLAYEGDTGPNTGGMGSYTDSRKILPFMQPGDYEKGLDIMRATILSFEKETGKQFKGVLYGQFILTKRGPKNIEFNSRFGDPECMNVMSLLESDLVTIFQKIASGTLSESDVKFASKATVCKYLVPDGYPDNPKKNEIISVDEKHILASGAKLFYASVSEKEGKIYTGSSRSIGLVGIGASIPEAEKIAEAATSFVKGPVRHRRDIGTAALLEKKIARMKSILA